MGKVLQRQGKRVFSFLLWVGVFTSFAFAQLPTATILGVVKDGTGAVVPGASLTARNTETGQTRTAVSAGDGSYRFSALPVGNYEVRVEQSGFQTEVRSGVTLTVSQEAVVNFTLVVGAVTQTVAVTAEAPLVNTTSGSLGEVVSERQVSDLPLNGRNYVDLTLLQPGVVMHQLSGTQTPNQSGVFFSANGAGIRSNYYMLDGAPMGNANTGSSTSTTNNSLGIEGIREWRVVTNSFSAEYGLRIGAQVVMVSKGGTNSFHGSLFEYLRNNALDARNFFDYPSVATGPDFRLPPYRRNQYGGSVGGPIQKDKAFFFATYEALKERFGNSNINNVPAAGCHGAAGATITNAACPQLGSVSSVTIAAAAAPLLTLYPLPNLPDNQFTFPSTSRTDEHYGQGRGDYIFLENDSLFVRHTSDSEVAFRPLGFPQFHTDLYSAMTFLTASETHLFSPALLGTFRSSFSRNWQSSYSPSDVSGPQYSFIAGDPIGQMTVGGLNPALGPDTNPPQFTLLNTFTYSGDLFYSRGRHSLKFGTLINHHQLYTYGLTSEHGSVSFSSLATFLQGQTNTYTAPTPGSKKDRTYHYNTLGFYVQDDFRARPSLTFNLGLRYEFYTDFDEVHGEGSALRDPRRDAAYTPGPPLGNTSKRLKNLSPRFGFAWDIRGDGKTALRGGFAEMFDTANVLQPVITSKTVQPPFSGQSQVTTPSTLTIPFVFPASAAGKTARTVEFNLHQTHMLSYNLTLERQLPANFAASLTYAGSRGLNVMQSHNANPTIPTVLPDGRLFWTGTEPRFNPNWTTVQDFMGSGNSWYNSFQFVLRKRLSKGLEFNSSYSFQKLIDQAGGVGSSENGGSTVTVNTVMPYELDQGPADWNISHAWHLSTIYHLPAFSGSQGLTGALLNGWWMSGILSAQTGLPFTVNLSSSRNRNGEGGTSLPNLVAGRNNSNITSGTTAGCLGVPAGQKLGTRTLYYDPCAFSIQQIGTLGNLGRNTLTAPGVFNLDFSLVKDASLRFLGEGGKLQFRAEAFNILNYTNFSRPSRSAFAGTADVQAPLSTAGLITKTDTKSRQIQLALRILF